MSTEFEINRVTYTCLKIDTFTQLTISRKGAPLFFGMAQIGTQEGQTIRDVYQEALSLLTQMSQEDFTILVQSIMPFIRRKDGTAWSKVYQKEANAFSYDDMDSGVVMNIIFKVLTEYLPPFFLGLDRIILGTPED